ncbi:uncharacterized protein PG986_012609 [Apiospora aurea]|uniref:Uncharacterized protein n=1 Tax=Apiospora aurea TaxID=335848 RepID=A0ABR1Q0G4_9PEZI
MRLAPLLVELQHTRTSSNSNTSVHPPASSSASGPTLPLYYLTPTEMGAHASMRDEVGLNDADSEAMAGTRVTTAGLVMALPREKASCGRILSRTSLMATNVPLTLRGLVLHVPGTTARERAVMEALSCEFSGPRRDELPDLVPLEVVVHGDMVEGGALEDRTEQYEVSGFCMANGIQ